MSRLYKNNPTGSGGVRFGLAVRCGCSEHRDRCQRLAERHGQQRPRRHQRQDGGRERRHQWSRPHGHAQQCACARHHVNSWRQRPACHHRWRDLRHSNPFYHLSRRHRELRGVEERSGDITVWLARSLGRHRAHHEERHRRRLPNILRRQHRL